MKQRPKTFVDCLGEFHSCEGSLGAPGGPVRFSLPIAEVLEAESVAQAFDLIESNMRGLQQHYSKSEDDVFYKDPPFLYLSEYAAPRADEGNPVGEGENLTKSLHSGAASGRYAIEHCRGNLQTQPELPSGSSTRPSLVMTLIQQPGRLTEFSGVIFLVVKL